jgi:hypothetical protein
MNFLVAKGKKKNHNMVLTIPAVFLAIFVSLGYGFLIHRKMATVKRFPPILLSIIGCATLVGYVVWSTGFFLQGPELAVIWPSATILATSLFYGVGLLVFCKHCFTHNGRHEYESIHALGWILAALLWLAAVAMFVISLVFNFGVNWNIFAVVGGSFVNLFILIGGIVWILGLTIFMLVLAFWGREGVVTSAYRRLRG